MPGHGLKEKLKCKEKIILMQNQEDRVYEPGRKFLTQKDVWIRII